MPTSVAAEYVGEERFRLLLSRDNLNPRAFAILTVEVDYSACEPEGVVLPLEMTVTGANQSFFQRTLITRSLPSTLFIRPTQGGEYLIRLAELGHNRWFGTLIVSVEGNLQSDVSVRRA